MPIPSAPIEWERKTLYKNPKNFSQVENTVTIATVLKNARKCKFPFKLSLKYSIQQDKQI